MKYLIMQCQELSDQWECDAHRIPMCITNDWKYPKRDYPFEVYEISENGSLKLIKEYTEPMEFGMVYGYYDDNDNFHLIKKFKQKTRHDKCPKDILKTLKSYDDFEDCLKNAGYISASKGNDIYCYVEYNDNKIYTPW